MSTKTLTEQIIWQRIIIEGKFVRKRKNGRVFFDLRKASEALAKELIASGALVITEALRHSHMDAYEQRAYVIAAIKKPGLEGEVG